MTKTVVQCDFDGTITEEDASFYLLDAHAEGDWRRLLQEYRQRRISVWDFNTRAFSMVRAPRSELLRTLRDNVKVRPGFQEFIDYCMTKGLRFAVVSNGLDFYIEAIMRNLGLQNIEVHAADTR
ncbi:MAG: HAD-IB family phosphatase, partial [Dehalococcoidia bacterium]